MKKGFVAGLAFAAFCTTTQAQQINLTDSARRLALAFASNAPSPLWRREMAEATRAHCRDLSTKLPRNTPEDDWVSGEMNSLDAARMTRVQDSVEFSRWSLTRFVSECVKVSNELLKKDLLSIKEAVLWIKLVRELNGSRTARTAP